jgi:hypothetical protein
MFNAEKTSPVGERTLKRKTTKEILAESFRELSKQKAVNKITVQEITDNCGYSPATFYRHFRDKYDLIAWDHTRVVAAFMGREQGSPNWEDTLLAGMKWFQKERDYLANLFLHTSGQDSFAIYMTEINDKALKTYIRDRVPGGELDEKMDMYIRIYCLGTVSLICEWVLGRFQVPPETLAEICRNSVPSPLVPYLQ